MTELSTDIRQLVETYQVGRDPQLLETLIQRSEQVVRSVVARCTPRQLPSSLDRDDLLQEGRCAVARCADGYCADYDGPFEAYAAAAVRNAVMSALRYAGAHKRGGSASSPATERQADSIPDPSPDPRQQAEHNELLALVDAMPDPQRAIITRSYFLGETDTAISEALNIPRMTVARHRARALETLRQHYETD